MFKKKKLPRLPKSGGYKTGDADDWTYEYTWEDMEEAEHRIMTTTIMITKTKEFSKIFKGIRSHFLKYPEKLLEEGYYKESGLTVDEIRTRLKVLQ